MSDSSNGHPRDLLSEYLDDELGLEERASVDRHLAGCEDCRAELAALRRLSRVLAEEGVPPVPADLESRIGRRLDAGTVVRHERWRFALPATIAATIGAVGLLVALQWRQGRIGIPTSPAPTPEPTQQEREKATPSFAPTPPTLKQQESAPPREKAVERSDALEKDLAATPEEKPKQKAEEAQAGEAAGVPGGVVGGVVGGVERGVPGGTGGRATNEAPTLVRPASAPAAKPERRSPCAEQWSDSGLRATWAVQDVAVAVQELDRMAGDVGGIGVWRGVSAGGLYMLVVPRGRFDEVYFDLRARGVGGLVAPPAVAPGNDCAGISILLAAAASPATPLPR